MGWILSFGLFVAAQSVEFQIEAGFNLERSAAEQLIQQYQLTPKKRTDYYIELYDGSQFLLIPHPDKYKFRLKAKNSKGTFQVNTKDAVYRRYCGAWGFNIKKKRVGELKLNKMQKNIFVARAKNQMRAIATYSNRGLTELRDFHQYAEGLQIPLMERIRQVPGDKPFIFTSSHLSDKVKYKRTLELLHGPVEVSVTDARDFVGDQFISRKFEVEFQIDDETVMSIDQMEESICHFMNNQGFTDANLRPARTAARETTLRQLQHYNRDLQL